MSNFHNKKAKEEESQKNNMKKKLKSLNNEYLYIYIIYID